MRCWWLLSACWPCESSYNHILLGFLHCPTGVIAGNSGGYRSSRRPLFCNTNDSIYNISITAAESSAAPNLSTIYDVPLRLLLHSLVSSIHSAAACYPILFEQRPFSFYMTISLSCPFGMAVNGGNADGKDVCSMISQMVA